MFRRFLLFSKFISNDIDYGNMILNKLFYSDLPIGWNVFCNSAHYFPKISIDHSSNLQDLESHITADLKRHLTVHFIITKLSDRDVMLQFPNDFSTSYQYDQRRPVQIDGPEFLHILD